MDKDSKYTKSNFDEFGYSPTKKDDIVSEIETKEATAPVVQKTTKKYTVIYVMLETKEIVLEDEFGNGVKLPLPDRYKTAKQGDVVYL